MIGIDKRKENRAAFSGNIPSASAPEMVSPDLDKPGIIAKD